MPATAPADGFNGVCLVPALKQCPGPASCVPRQLDSTFTFDTIILRSSASKYAVPGKPVLFLDVRGVRDAAGALVTGNLALRTPAGRVGLPTLGTFPDDSPLTQTAPLPIPLENGNNRKFAYAPSTAIPNGTITNGGGVNAGEAVAAAPLEKEPAR